MTDAGKSEHGVPRMVILAWLVTSIFYFQQYLMRSAPSVMMPELAGGFGLTEVAVASLAGLFYYGYAPFSLIAGAALDQFGLRRVVPVGALAVGLGGLMFAFGDPRIAAAGRLLQGAGGAFALLGAAFIAGRYFPASQAATLIGATQVFGMAGGSAGQFVVGPAIAAGAPWRTAWAVFGVAGLVLAGLLLAVLPRPQPGAASAARRGWLGRAMRATGVVLRNPQSILCGLIAGLMFMPTTVFGMVWGVRYLQEAHEIPYSMAVLRSAALPFGWMIGCPLLGVLSDRIGRRKPIIFVGALVLLLTLALILYGPPWAFPPFTLALVAGIGSGAAMIPYTVIKEANRPEHAGTATGVVNFINFALSALLGPLLGLFLAQLARGLPREAAHYQLAFEPLIWGVGLALLLTLYLRETGAAVRAPAVGQAEVRSA
jgi:MFS family permease